MLGKWDTQQIIGGYCTPRHNRKGVKYIALTKDTVIGTLINCKIECPFYPCIPKPYLVAPITSELKTALKLFFPKIRYDDDDHWQKFAKREKDLRKFMREWVKKK